MNQSQAATAIANREDFEASALSGARGVPSYAGLLTGADLNVFHDDRASIAYTVYSYATPIAWVTLSGRKHIVSQRFSVTTSKHQGIVRRSI